MGLNFLLLSAGKCIGTSGLVIKYISHKCIYIVSDEKPLWAIYLLYED